MKGASFGEAPCFLRQAVSYISCKQKVCKLVANQPLQGGRRHLGWRMCSVNISLWRKSEVLARFGTDA